MPPPSRALLRGRAAGDGEHAPQVLAVRLDRDAAALCGDVMVDDAADQRHVPRPRQLGVGDATTGPGGSVRGDDAVLNHQIRLTHPDAAPASLIGAAVADGQALEGDIDRVGSGAAHVEHPVQLPAVDDCGTCSRARNSVLPVTSRSPAALSISGPAAASRRRRHSDARSASSFGDIDTWRKDFTAIGGMRGVGWAVTYLDTATGRLSNHWITLHEDGNIAGFKPIVVMDVWEHAFLLDYKPADRPKYIEAFLANFDADAAEARLDGSSRPPRRLRGVRGITSLGGAGCQATGDASLDFPLRRSRNHLAQRRGRQGTGGLANLGAPKRARHHNACKATGDGRHPANLGATERARQ